MEGVGIPSKYRCVVQIIEKSFQKDICFCHNR